MWAVLRRVATVLGDGIDEWNEEDGEVEIVRDVDAVGRQARLDGEARVRRRQAWQGDERNMGENWEGLDETWRIGSG